MSNTMFPQLDWLAAVATRAQVAKEEAAEILGSWRIEPSPGFPQPHHLELQRVSFAGIRPEGVPEPGPFAFDWDGLGPGVWALASDANGAGKTSVLEIIVWALRGIPRKLQADVRMWLSGVDVRFAIDDVSYRVRFDLTGGRPTGALSVLPTGLGEETEILHFGSEAVFEDEMGSFMLERLGLHPLLSWNKQGGGGMQEHGWNALMGAIHIPRTNHPALLGEEMMAGLPGRLLQVFLGVPWAMTVFTAQSALKAVRSSASQLPVATAGSEPARRTELAAHLETLRGRLSELKAATSAVPDANATFASLVSTADALADTRRQFMAAKADVHAAEDALTELKRTLLDRRETALAERFFHGLNPSLCPRCDTPISTERREREGSHQECAVCVTHVGLELPGPPPTSAGGGASDADPGDAPTSVEALQAKLIEAELLVLATRQGETDAGAAVASAEAAAASAEQKAATVRASTEFLAELRQIELEVARLEGASSEADRIDDSILTARKTGVVEERIVKAACDEASARMEAAQGDLFDELNTEITRLGRRFGMDTLTAVNINRAAHVKAVKGGVTSNFTNLTPGERLRLRVAVIVALLRIGQRRQVGRHPGLLLLDSPGAEETEEGDATALVGELHRIADEIPNLQVIAATARPSLLADIPDQRVLRAYGEDRLW